MADSITLSSFFLFCLLYFPYFAASVENCLNNQCSKDEPGVSFPFRLNGRQSERCGYPGFDLACGNTNRTILELPFSEPFFVYDINYGSNSNEIKLQDPDNCLARRFLNQLNFSGTPFIGFNYTNYSFFNCSSQVSTSFTAPLLSYSTSISCLGSSTHAVFATSPESRDSSWLKRNCPLLSTIPIPVGRYYSRGIPTGFPYETFLHLTWRWNEQYCKRNCNKYPNVPYIISSSTGDRIDTKKLLISIGIILPTMIGFIFYCICRSEVNNQSEQITSGNIQTTPQSVITITGLHVSATLSFPTVILGESGRLPDPDINTCAICLSEYQPKETLKTLPSCNHCFHADCIDVWLHLNSTCPVCRKSLVP